jgi:hypothetical protein
MFWMRAAASGGGLVDHPEEELFPQGDLGGGAHGPAFVTVQQYNFLFFLFCWVV